MKAQRLLDERVLLGEAALAELRVSRVSAPVSDSLHDLKYSLALIVSGVCVLRYDNETGKGDHKHIGAIDRPYRVTTAAALVADFWHDADHWKGLK